MCHDANKWPTAGNLEAAMAEVRRERKRGKGRGRGSLQVRGREQEMGRRKEALHESKNAVDDIKNKEKQTMVRREREGEEEEEEGHCRLNGGIGNRSWKQ